MDKDIKPAVCVDSDGRFVYACFQNEKAKNKSLEQGELWEYLPEGGRVLPVEGIRIKKVSEKQGWIELLTDSVKGDSSGETVQKEKISAAGTVLEKLEQIIKKRRQEMPEGSYTSHLFSKGGEKIRKKTGEEAVELILAAKKEEISYEAADLIYHLIVLLVWEDIPLSDVLSELESRF
ncbi:phosphoribosyl-ATP diphosphatase [Spirochaetia bacterium 38H-sp]|uniref:Phosphoribosyl-ATP pyrophosphatase n=1 Tax=Rarispira pelagica TaxID=3141764 RepID=A0ABU9U9H7_9SPIR